MSGLEDVGYEIGFGLIGKSGKIETLVFPKGFMIGRTVGAGSHAMRSRCPNNFSSLDSFRDVGVWSSRNCQVSQQAGNM